MTSPQSSSPPLVDLHRLGVALRRRRRLWLGFALAGLVIGGTSAVVLPAAPTAVTKVLVVHPDDSPTDSGTLMRTDVAVLQTGKIASAALKKLGSTEAPADFLKEYTGLGMTNNIMQVSVKAKTNADAVAKAQALADVFIADHVQRNQAAATAQAKALLDQRAQAQQQLADVDAQVAAETDKGSKANAGTLEQLYTQRADLVSKVADLQNQAQQAGIGTPQVAAGTQIVDAPVVLPASLLKTGATDGAIGLALGLALGLGFAAVTALVRDRPVLRREIAEHLGASVIAQLRSKLPGPSRLWSRGSAVVERKRVAVTLARAIRSERGPLAVLELGAPGVAAELALNLAKELAEDGPVVVVDDLPHRDVGKLPVEGDVRVAARVTRRSTRRPGASASARSRRAPRGRTWNTWARRRCSSSAPGTRTRCGCTRSRASSPTAGSRSPAWCWSTRTRRTTPTAHSGTACTRRCGAGPRPSPPSRSRASRPCTPRPNGSRSSTSRPRPGRASSSSRSRSGRSTGRWSCRTSRPWWPRPSWSRAGPTRSTRRPAGSTRSSRPRAPPSAMATATRPDS